MREKIICPACGAEMNFHAEKLIYSQTDLGARTAMDVHLEEIHTCPRCGRAESRACEGT